MSFDLQSNAAGGHYSWAREIADRCQADVWIMEVQGHGASSRPGPMSDPCNILKVDQQSAFGQVLCEPPSWTGNCGSSDSEWQELDAVVDHVRSETLRDDPSWASRFTGRVVLIGYSAGANVVGPYAMQHPEKVWGLLLLAPIFPPDGPSDRPGPPADPVVAPDPTCTEKFYGAPMGVLTNQPKGAFWPTLGPNASCPEPPRNEAVIDDIWNAMMQDEPGSGLVPGHQIYRWPTRYWWGWNQSLVSADPRLGKEPVGGALVTDVGIPVLIIAGLRDGTIRAKKDLTDGRGAFSVDSLYEAIAGRGKAMMYDIECGSHLIMWQEPYRHKLHDLSIEWLTGFANYVGPARLAPTPSNPGASNPAFRPVSLPHGGSGRYFVPRNGGRPREWNGHVLVDSRPRRDPIIVRPNG
ncbi:alpha/beta fold hydrolase [Micromonospora kangleipakensis]|uniref:alpha/beta fold hydrolase n=1 Tax=Micromonospora kangleipakensis TaxID=1077942 RepID=UPI001A936D35|nr:alpha/beta fold hydrolase [Micromonospora kangleipakensis]